MSTAIAGFDTVAFEGLLRMMWAWLATQPRMLAMFTVVPLFGKQAIPMTMRMAISAAFGFVAMPVLLAGAADGSKAPPGLDGVAFLLSGAVGVSTGDVAGFVVWVFKEAFIGLVLGYAFSVPFWILEGVGFFIDNQRGAGLGATLDPLTGNDSSPLGQLFLQAFVVFFVIANGPQMMLTCIYDSFHLWPPASWYPSLRGDSVPAMLDMLSNLVRTAILLASPVMIVMFMTEVGIALISRFVPQLQVFFIAMPVKSAVAFFVLVLYIGTLMQQLEGVLTELGGLLRFLNAQW
ncbi:type III secretion system export apparatus subunit SctT [Robbsia andropogonis]|nr:type III secretion system export apparatus subunit SctT [Robbsia andropogonis]MCP1117105.1 type III secretion system export apparatus subunit SctT [Robbsia andropogonis]MCP1128451.1 type III secretion system export apparatus subunit SctT [Robbsia andropogonis]